MKTIQITDRDSTCFEATMRSGAATNSEDIEFAAIPDNLNAIKAEVISAKLYKSVRLFLEDGSAVEIKAFIADSPEEAILESLKELKSDGAEEENLEWWKNYR